MSISHMAIFVYMAMAQYKGDKGDNVAARPPEGGPTEAEGLSALSLLWSINRPARMPDSPLNGQPNYPPSQLCPTYLWGMGHTL